jgi:REP element-mobilizing transposase RayT
MGDPLAYFLTWTCYGTWLHGDGRLSVDRKHNGYGRPLLAADPRRASAQRRRMAHPEITLTADDRSLIERAIRETCEFRSWRVHAMDVRSNHAHLVVSGPAKPERIMQDTKSWGTRAMRDAGRIGPKQPLWTDHGSTIYIWTPEQLGEKVDYVQHRQDDPERFKHARPSEPGA